MTELAHPSDLHSDSHTSNAAENQDPSQKLLLDADARAQLAGPTDASLAAPSSGAAKFGEITWEGVKDLPEGIAHTVEQEGVSGMLQTVAGSAAFGGLMKVALPEGGPVAALGGLGLAAYFGIKSAMPVVHAYEKGMSANTEGGVKAAGAELGDVFGNLAVNVPLSVGGFKIGSSMAASALASQSMDGFAEWKAAQYDKLESKFPRLSESIGQHDQITSVRAKRLVNGRANFLGSERLTPGDTKVGQVDPNKPMRVTLKVARQNQVRFDRLVERIKAGKADPISREEFNSKFGADPKALADVRKFAADNGLKVEGENAAARSVTLSGTAGAMSKAFHADLNMYERGPNDAYVGRTGMYSVPENLGNEVTAVIGLDQRGVFKPNFVLDSASSQKLGLAADSASAKADPLAGDGSGSGNSPEPMRQRPLPADAIMKSYGGDSARYTNKGGHTAFLSFGGTIDDAAFKYLQDKGIDPKTVGQIDRTWNGTTPDPKGANVENQLDLVDQKLNLRDGKVDMISNDNGTQGFVGGIDYVNHPSSGVEYQGSSTSWGGPDRQAWDANGRHEFDQSLKDGIALGKTHTFSSGDDGATDRGSLPVQTDYPASSGNGIAVGGTKEIVDSSGHRVQETAWSTHGATGGGVSAVEPRPNYQNFIKGIKSASGSSFKGRIVPDISMNASPETPAEVPTDSGLIGVGGTSSSNPLFQAMVRQLSEASGKPIGFVNSMLYKWGQDPLIAKKVFNDVTVGDNKQGGAGYSAGPGFDAVTGWGSPNFQGMLEELTNPSNPMLSAVRRGGYRAYYNTVNTARSLAHQPSLIVQHLKGLPVEDPKHK